MSKLQSVKIVNVERNKVFKIGTDFDGLVNRLPQYFTLVRIRSVRDDTSVIEIHIQIGGKNMAILTKHVIKPPEIHEIFVLSGDIKGSHITLRYEPMPNGTKIAIEINYKLKRMLRLTSFFSKNKIKKEIDDLIDKFARMIEEQQ